MFKVLGIGCGVLLLTGCGSDNTKVLTCTLDSERVSAKAQMTFNADGTELQSITISEDVEANESFLEEMEDLSSDEICDEADLPLATCNANIKGNILHIEGTVATRDIDEVFNGVDDSVTYNSVKEAAEEDGFTCN